LLKLRDKLHYRGQLFCANLGIYSVMRFLIEFLRKGVSAEVAVGPLTQAQVACIIILGSSILLFYYLQQNTQPFNST
jgi:prolipoprotein diacylglyceryltransferase